MSILEKLFPGWCQPEGQTEEEASVLLADGDAETAGRLNAARDSGTAPEVLAALIADPNPFVRAAAAANPSTPDEVLLEGTGSDDWFVRQAAERNLAGRRSS